MEAVERSNGSNSRGANGRVDGRWRKWKERGNQLGEKLVGANNNQTDRIDSTYTLLLVMVKAERQEKEVKEGETYHHCSHLTMRLSMTTMMYLPCTNQPSCRSNVSMAWKRRGWAQEASKLDEWKPRYGLRFPLWGVHEFALFRFVKKWEKRKVGSKFVLVVAVVLNLRRNRVENPPSQMFEY